MLNYSKGTSLGEKKPCNSFIPHKQGPTSTAQALRKNFIGLYVDHLPFLDCTSSPLAEGPGSEQIALEISIEQDPGLSHINRH